MESNSSYGVNNLEENKPVITEEKGIFFLTVVSDDLSSREVLKYLIGKGIKISDDAKRALSSNEYVPTSRISYKIAIFNGNNYRNELRNLKRVYELASILNYERSTLEISYLLSKSLTYNDIKNMNFGYIAVCHMPVQIDVNTHVICSLVSNAFGTRIDAFVVDETSKWPENTGFAFIVSATLV